LTEDIIKDNDLRLLISENAKTTNLQTIDLEIGEYKKMYEN
jgi:hypothetical protein